MVRFMRYDYSYLLRRIEEVFCSEIAFAEAMGISEKKFKAIIGGDDFFEECEIVKAATLLSIPDSEINRFFFCRSSSGMN